MARVKAQIFISGQVQRVGFRYFVKGKLAELGLTGWVKNLPDGRVEVELEGEKERIETMIAWCKEGPPLARVRQVDVLYYRT